MIFDDLQAGESVFVDANTLIYHFISHIKYGLACTRLFERIENQEIQGFTISHCLADVAHRVMTIEAMGQLGWPATGLAARLKKHHSQIPNLRLYQQAAEKVSQLSIQVLPVTEHLVLAATQISELFELLTGDALIVAAMRLVGISNLANGDADFDRVPSIIRYSPV
jgi:predicted nucleic acid-binding protein